MLRVDRHLRDYISLFKFRFSLSDHKYLVQTYYALMTSPELDAIYIKMFCTTFIKLLSHSVLLPRNELELDWKVWNFLQEKFNFFFFFLATLSALSPRLSQSKSQPLPYNSP